MMSLLNVKKRKLKNPSAIIQSFWEQGFPYTGAHGGASTFSFTPTSLGIAVRATDAITDEIIDLSDYEDW